ncbi:MAG: hypothetical protein GY950_13645, partial [bacterium]|nr:hypothetical protein [bacterium]
MMKKSIIIVLLTCVIAFQGIIHGEENSGDELLISTLTGKNWNRLPTLFQDGSFKILKKYFSEARAIKVVTSEENRLTYNAKFSSRGEIGVIVFEKKEGKYLNVKIKNQIKPLYFIDKFKKYPVSNLQLFIGDARIHFSSGYFYHSLPFQWLLIFEGRWSISIKPGDKEEKLTLKRKFKKDFFAESSNSGVFILHNTDFLARLQPEGEVTAAGKGSQAIYNMYREAYGIKVTQFDEYWYLPFPRETNLMMFAKDKKSYYYYTYNESMVPDTQLTVSGNNDMLLSYNAHRGLKLSFGEAVNVSRLNLNVYFNPKDNVISGTTSISFKNSASVRELNLKEGIDVVGNLTPGSKGLNIFRKKDRYYLMGAENNTLALYFKGRIEPTEENLELFKTRQEVVRDLDEDQEDAFYFLSKTQHFYPNPGEEFFA